MEITTRQFAAVVLAASAAVLGAALASQYWGGLIPCELCLKERWPWDAAAVIAVVALVSGSARALSPLALVLGLVFAAGAVLAFYHVGVERHWFAGPATCTASGGHATTIAEMRALILNAQPIQCDQVQWSLFGISLAGWNFFASLTMMAGCFAVFWRGRVPSRRPGGERRTV